MGQDGQLTKQSLFGSVAVQKSIFKITVVD